jgi:putative ABC transport system permease protein
MAWYHRLLNVLRPGALSRDLDREIASHLAERADDLVAAGLSPEEAVYEARRRFGNSTAQKELTRGVDGLAWLEALVADTRYAFRSLRKSPGFTAVAVLSLALGIGANTAIFSLTNAVVLRSLPVRAPGELVSVRMGEKGGAYLTNPIWEELRGDSSVFAGSLAYGSTSFNLAQSGEVRRARGNWVSGSFFTVLGVRPAAGRLLLPADDVRGCAPLAVLSGGFARREHGSAEAAVGKSVSIEGHPFEVIGVADPAFTGIEVGLPPDVYLPLCAQVITTGRPNILDARSRWYLSVIGRRRPGMSVARLDAQLSGIAPRVFAATLPTNWDTKGQREYLAMKLRAEPAAAGLSELRDSYRRALFTLMVVVGMVLLIACANIANLLLARAATRQREIAIRLAVGVGRWRLTRQLLTESLLLSLLGAGAGVAFSQWASRLIVGLLSTGVRPIWLDLSPDWRVLGFTVLLATLTGVGFGLVPAWRASHVDPQATLKAGGRGLVRSNAARRVGRVLVVGQVALSLVLVAVSALLLGSFRRLMTLDSGFDRSGVLLVAMNFRNAGTPDSQLIATQTELLRRIREQPGLGRASASVITPIGHIGWNDFVIAPGFVPASKADSLAWFNQVSDGYFATMGTALLAGRDITAEDIAGKRNVVVISETFAKRVFGSNSAALGKSFRTPVGNGTSPPYEVVGVVRDARYERLDEEVKALGFFPLGVGDVPSAELSYEVRTAGGASGAVAQLRALATAAHPGISLEFTTLAGQVAESLARPRLLAALSGFFGLLALLLAMVGLYGTMAYNVSQRRNEIGIRMALGAGNPRVLRMVVGEATRLIAAGVAAGTLLALATTRLVSAFLYGVSATDAATLGFSAGLLMLIGLAAAFAPAWRAAQLDPMTALRED